MKRDEYEMSQQVDTTNYKEKYEQALERAKKGECIENIFPELCESEDRKWRNWLIGHLKGYINQTDDKYAEVCKKAIAWLEKQDEQELDIRYSILDKLIDADDIYQISVNDAMICEARNKAISALSKLEIYKSLGIEKNVEQKPAWSEEDERMFHGLISIVEDWYNTMSEEEKEYYGDCGYIHWLKSLKDRVQPQPKQEWSEEDMKFIDALSNCINELKEKCGWNYVYVGEKDIPMSDIANWLKSIKTNHWKPSEYDISLLEEIARNIRNNVRPFCSEVSSLEDLIKNIKTL